MILFGLMLMQELNKMSKSHSYSPYKIKCYYNEEDHIAIIPLVDNETIIPKIKIHDIDGTYWYREIGFNRRINQDDRKCHS